MLRIRLTRTGKKNQPSFRIVVAEHSRPVKGKYLELLGHYSPATDPKEFTIKKERVEYWLQQGAKPSETMATLLKNFENFSGMEDFMSAPNKKRKKKKASEEEAEGAPAEAKAEGGDAPAADAKADAPKEEAKTDEAPKAEAEEKPAEEEAKADAA